ncbi:MAG: GNAT family N-acetyltransferase [Candidatus Promineifilaceae bacterium]|jgi:ribosomal protein S18 acetylase RimI-like enzyme
MIRPYQDRDANLLAPIHTAVFPDDPLSRNTFADMMAHAFDYGGKAWIVIDQESPVGYALVVPVPGLPQIGELSGCIAHPYQRRGLGSRLLRHVLSDLQRQGTAVRQFSHQVSSLNSPTARFLIKNDFYVEHEEIILRRGDLQNLLRPPGRAGLEIVTLLYPDAVNTFQELFSASFAGLPWDQPFDQAEIETILDNAADILFLELESQPIGFAWLHLEQNNLGLIEPLGILPAYQHQGYGRFLLRSTLLELLRRGAVKAQIGAWHTNKPAISLYESLGFRHHQTITYLAKDI